MCDVPSIAVFCGESIECFPVTAYKFSFKLLVNFPVAPIITDIIVHFMSHIRCISIHKLLYFNFFSASFCTFLSAGIATSISVHVFSFLFLIIVSGRRKLHDEELSDLYSLPNIVRVVKSRRMRWVGHVARMGGEERCAESSGWET